MHYGQVRLGQGGVQGVMPRVRSRQEAALKICIVSDSHDRADPLLAAVAAAKRDGAQAVIHCGDVIGTNTLRPLLALGLPVHVVHGNNLGDPVAMPRLAAASNGLITYHGGDADIELDGLRVFATHFPHYARGMACTGDYALVCCGHSHEPSIEQQANITGGRTWLVNPGTVAGVGGDATWILGDLGAMSFELRRD
jgi:putative phosphoesterase